MLLPTITRGSMLLRLLCGLALVGSAFGAGFLRRSPWTIATLGLAFSVLFVLGKWDAWKHAVRASGWQAILGGVASVVPTQCGMVALFYGTAVGLAKLMQPSTPLASFDGYDLRYGAATLGVGMALAIAAHILESRAGDQDDLMLQLMADDASLPQEMRAQILDSNRDSSAA